MVEHGIITCRKHLESNLNEIPTELNRFSNCVLIKSGQPGINFRLYDQFCLLLVTKINVSVQMVFVPNIHAAKKMLD